MGEGIKLSLSILESMKKWLATHQHQILLFWDLGKHPILGLRRLEVLAKVCDGEEVETQQQLKPLLLCGRGKL